MSSAQALFVRYAFLFVCLDDKYYNFRALLLFACVFFYCSHLNGGKARRVRQGRGVKAAKSASSSTCSRPKPTPSASLTCSLCATCDAEGSRRDRVSPRKRVHVAFDVALLCVQAYKHSVP